MRCIQFLIFCTVWFPFRPLSADGEDLRLARAALDDRLLEVAETRFRRLMEAEDSASMKTEAALGLARIQLLRGRPGEAADLLSDLPGDPDPERLNRVNLLRAEVALLRDDASTADALLAVTPPMEGDREIRRRILKARALSALGKPEEALEFLEESESAEEPAITLRRAALLWSLGREASAGRLWETLAAGPADRVETVQAVLALLRRALEEEDGDAVARWLEAALRAEEVPYELEPRAYALIIQALESQGRFALAADYLRAMEARVRDPEKLETLQSRRAMLRVKAGDLEAGDALLKQLIATRGDHPVLAEAQLLLARKYLEREAFGESRAAYENFLSVFTGDEVQLEARMGLAHSLESLDNPGMAALWYEKSWNQAPSDHPLRPRILVKWAEMLAARDQHEAALRRYRQMRESHPDSPLVPMAMFHAALSQAETEGLTPALDTLARLRSLYPDSDYAERALLQRAALLDRFLRLERALGAYDAYLERYPEGRYLAHAMTDKGIAAYRLGLFDLALRLFEEVEARFPETERAEQAFSLRGWALYLLGRDREARETGQAFLRAHPESDYAPDIRFWLAEMSFNRGDYESAQALFREIVESTPTSAVKSKAHYLAGRSALARREYDRALRGFTASLEADPGAPHAPDALFHQGDALTELDRFDEGIVVFDQLLTRHGDSYLAHAARGRKGDCQFTLGEKNPDRYLEALSSYRMVEENPAAPPELRIQAMYKVGRTLAALERTPQARDHYLKAIHEYMTNRGRLGEDAAVWFVRAVTDAAQSYEQAGEYREAIRVYRKLVESGLPQAGEARRRVEDLRREHLIFF